MDLELRGGSAPGKETLDGAHQSVERGARVALAEVSGGEAASEAVDAGAAHGLVAEAEAGEDITSHDEAPAADDRAALVDGEDAGPEGLPGAAVSQTLPRLAGPSSPRWGWPGWESSQDYHPLSNRDT